MCNLPRGEKTSVAGSPFSAGRSFSAVLSAPFVLPCPCTPEAECAACRKVRRYGTETVLLTTVLPAGTLDSVKVVVCFTVTVTELLVLPVHAIGNPDWVGLLTRVNGTL